MNNDSDSLYILAQNLEGAACQIAKVRQYLLDHQMFDQWIELVYASGALISAIERVAEMLKLDERWRESWRTEDSDRQSLWEESFPPPLSQQQSIVEEKGDLNT